MFPASIASPYAPIGAGRLSGAIVLGLIGLSVSGCGSGTSASAVAHHASGGVTEQATLSSSSSAAAKGNAHCTNVAAPTPRPNEHVPKPTTKLDPTKSYVVNLETNCGSIAIKLDVKRAPKIAASFAYLVKRGFYNGLTFHRVVAGFVIQGGDPNGNGTGGPGYTVVERPPENLQYTRGVVAMAKTQSDPAGAAGSQFFIVTGANVELPPQYALLGKVVGDESAVSAISKVPIAGSDEGEESSPRNPVVIEKATLNIN